MQLGRACSPLVHPGALLLSCSQLGVACPLRTTAGVSEEIFGRRPLGRRAAAQLETSAPPTNGAILEPLTDGSSLPVCTRHWAGIATSMQIDRGRASGVSRLIRAVTRRGRSIRAPAVGRDVIRGDGLLASVGLDGDLRGVHGMPGRRAAASWFSPSFSRPGLPIASRRSPEKKKAPHCRAFFSAPKRTRTSTGHSSHKALNLARLPIPPPAQVGQPGPDGRWRGPSIAPRGA